MFESYLSGRSQRVVLNGKSSEFLNIFGSVPQSSIHSSLFCLVYLNDIAELSTGRMDPRVGSGRVGSGRAGSGRVMILPDLGGSGQHFGFFSFFTDYFLVPETI